jgi:hypothetical protein
MHPQGFWNCFKLLLLLLVVISLGQCLIVIGEAFFDLLIIPLSYNFKSHVKSTYPPLVRSIDPWRLWNHPSHLASHLSSTYTSIGSSCKLTPKTFLIVFFKLQFLEIYKRPWNLWWTLSPLPSCFMVLILFFTINTSNMRKGSPHYWVIFKHKAWWPFKRFFIYLSPLSNIFRNHCMSPNYVFPSLMDKYTHRGHYEQDSLTFDHFLTHFNLIGLKVKVSKCKLWSPLKIF